ncbi:DUF4270 family protein [Tenacibaculum salmonis]|uniref:DUF4270 family protein n=1 Tax=Tenacibaculum sp. P3-BQ1 TaxID=3232310 RepID=UPI0034DF84FB
MIRKIGVLGISLLCLATIISCEKDFNDVSGRVIDNTKFETGELLLDVAIEKIDISDSNTNDAYKAVRADNISSTLGEYWLGVYKDGNYKGIEASIISQLAYVSGLKNKATSGTDTIYNLDKVILKIPYPATSTGVSEGMTSFKLDSILGSPSKPTSLKVFQNETFLSSLNPSEPSKKNTYLSNKTYLGTNLLNEDDTFTFSPNAKKDTIFSYSKINRMDPSKTYLEEVKVKTSSESAALPFLAIPLDLTKMKPLFWDKFEGNEFASKKLFDEYFYGLKIMASGNEGSLVPFNLSSTPTPSLDFHYTKSVMDGSTVKDTLNRKYSFPLSGIKNSKYVMSDATTTVPSNNFVVQGTAGTMAKITILNESKLQELRDDKLLINDASLTFYVNQNINTNKNIVPQKLFIYQNIDKGTKGIVPTQLTDAYKEIATFGGYIQLSEDDKPEKYSFSIKDYISDLLDGTTSDIEPLILKVYNNPTDSAIKNNAIDVNVRTYNWNPRGVTLLNGSETANGVKRAVLKISYSKEK